MRSWSGTFRSNVRMARSTWGELSEGSLQGLRELTKSHHLSIARGEVQQLEGHWYVTHSGLLRVARNNHCLGIQVQTLRGFCDAEARRWVFKATVYKSPGSRGFTGYGDADPSNVSALVRGAEMRVAETRAVNRALRKAYGIGLCSVEELGWTPRVSGSPQSRQNASSVNGAHGNGHSATPRLRDRLCFLIREHQLDPTLVKAYAADYCGTPALHNARRDQIEAFINHLSERATKDRAALLCHLNSFAKPHEVTS
jgi:hypothetical protein